MPQFVELFRYLAAGFLDEQSTNQFLNNVFTPHRQTRVQNNNFMPPTGTNH